MILPLLLHPPKTGGTSIHNALIQKYGSDAVPMTKSNSDLQTSLHWTYDRFDLPDNYPAVICVRNPYVRFYSLYAHRKHLVAELHDVPFSKFMKGVFKLGPAYRKRPPQYLSYHTSPMSAWHCSQVVDLIRYETFARDIERIYNLDINEYDHIHNTGARSSVSDVAEHYTQPVLDFINYHCSRDFQLFGYTKYNHIEEMMAL